MAIKIITDSGSDLPLEYVEKYNVTIVHLPVHFGHDLMPEDTETKVFYQMMRESKSCRQRPVQVRKVSSKHSRRWNRVQILWSSACHPISAVLIRQPQLPRRCMRKKDIRTRLKL